MLITKLKEAEKIVDQFKDLHWEGWDIVSIEYNPDGYTNKFGVFVNNKWAIKKIYSVNRDGWKIPNKYKVVQ
jgi:hypothetical protein